MLLNVNFFLRGAESCSHADELTISCQLSIEAQPRDTPFSTRLRVQKHYWWTSEPNRKTPSGQWVLPGHYNEEYLNRQLIKIEQAFRNIYDVLPLLYPNEPITYEMLRSHYDPESSKIVKATQRNTPKKPTLKQLYTDLLAVKIKKHNISINTQKTYRSRMNNIEAFFKNKRIDEIRHRDVEAFEMYLIDQKDEHGNTLYCRNYRNKHLTLLKHIVEFAVKKEIIQASPIVGLDLQYDEDKPPQYLLPNQRKALFAVDVANLQRAKDIAIFLIHTGFSYVDYLELNSSHLIGKGWKKQRHKTKVWSLPPLLPEAQAIIKKYGSIEALPRPDASDLNKELKFLATFAGIEKNLLHPLCISDFRETFASMMENEYMLEGRVVQAMMGHKNARQLQSYSRLMPERVLYELELSIKKRE
jgi:site-specific recombinase XerD